VIGPSSASSRVILAFGHQHIGLTLGGVTGKIVTDLARGQAPSCDISNLPPTVWSTGLDCQVFRRLASLCSPFGIITQALALAASGR
jgi:hypothetical protein